MAAILVLAALRAGETLADLRSPLIPPPADHPAATPSPASSRPSTASSASSSLSSSRPPLTERSLRASHLAWLVRVRDLSARHLALVDARSKNWTSCWAGKVSSRHIRAVKKAIEEAQWVEERLRLAIGWCKEKGLRKVSVKRLLGGKGNHVDRGDRRNRLAYRPTHTSFPPSLLDLPYPLPLAFDANFLILTVPRPPPISRHRRAEEDEVEALPAYREEADHELGERMLERGLADVVVGGVDVEQYERETHGQAVQVAVVA
ncbi:uncharacterized protein RHTO_01750 [Rhodotorula toruloides NP11]|uniref:Uncharacterized protein n=1 Tax=Rhodotorula toruloides (strain NP11) TaxID=1130832 RepID=M7XC03_RHOT1|nr:uncharacterized protein RHTO_01750 [Rhodotorula toruloides NP11]EMS21284.1 hypothetical protein RHTO_01750 [Rhodotorula toruloides NP11]